MRMGLFMAHPQLEQPCYPDMVYRQLSLSLHFSSTKHLAWDGQRHSWHSAHWLWHLSRGSSGGTDPCCGRGRSMRQRPKNTIFIHDPFGVNGGGTEVYPWSYGVLLANCSLGNCEGCFEMLCSWSVECRRRHKAFSAYIGDQTHRNT